MTTSYFRLHPAGRPVEQLLDPSDWESRQWFGEKYIECYECSGTGCEGCDNLGEIEDVRHGVSTCASTGDLVTYFRQVGADLDDTVLVELEATLSDDTDHDAALGAVLVHPTRIVSVIPTPDSIIDAILQEV